MFPKLSDPGAQRPGIGSTIATTIRKIFAKFFDKEAILDDQEESSWFEKMNFTNKEVRELKAAIRACPQQAHFITLNGITLPMPGHIFRVRESAMYQLMRPGSLVLVSTVVLFKQYWTYAETPVQVNCLPLDESGHVDAQHVLPIPAVDLEAVPNENDYITKWSAPEKKISSPFVDGDAVETAEEIIRMREGLTGAAAIKLPKGLKGVIEQPEVQRGGSLGEINSVANANKVPVITHFVLVLNDGQEMRDINRRVLSIPVHAQGDTCQVYIPSFRQTIPFQASQIRKREFDKTLLDKVVLSDKTRQQILWLANSNEDDVRRWNIPSLQKGTGKIFLAYGPPGNGKTMTGEALAEYLGRPLYLVNSADLGVYTSDFETKFKQMITRTDRWNAVTVIDEAESILQSRDISPGDSNARVTAVLRNLELLERGLIWFTTNRPFDIDFAIESRIRSQIYFPFLDTAQRREVWKMTLPPGLPVKTDNLDRLLDALAETILNGREIRNAIVNAADMASSDRHEHIPGDYLMTASQIIVDNRETLENAKKRGQIRPTADDKKINTGQYL